ncbi:MAG TPA: SOS response-associated peptidase [Trueperaceae bacterium]
MCGRYTLYSHEDDLATLFEVETYPLTPRYNIAPTTSVPIIRQRSGGQRVMEEMRWGLLPHWVKDPKDFRSSLFNARAESAGEKPSFRDSMRSQRCLVPASGFYEWRTEDGAKQPYYVYRADGQPMAFAGLWALNRNGEVPIASCTILTTEANVEMRQLHHRMPVILEKDEWDRWLDADEKDPTRLEDLLDPADGGILTMHPVDRSVGSPKFDSPACVQRLA